MDQSLFTEKIIKKNSLHLISDPKSKSYPWQQLTSSPETDVYSPVSR